MFVFVFQYVIIDNGIPELYVNDAENHRWIKKSLVRGSNLSFCEVFIIFSIVYSLKFLFLWDGGSCILVF
jgi:hypothetical protein